MKRKNSIKRFWILLGLVLLPLLSGLAQPQQADSLLPQPPHWQQRHFSEQTLQELQEDRSMDYALAKADDNWWDRFKRWLGYKISQMLDQASGNGFMDTLFYVFCIGAGIFIVVRFLDIDLSSLLHRKAAGTTLVVGEGLTENIHELNFDTEIQQAVAGEDFRRAVRLLYLASLKQLADGGHIRWEPGKTNQQYQQEVKAAALGASFGRLGYYFEWAWYGDFPVSSATYQEVEQEYQEFSKKLEVPA